MKWDVILGFIAITIPASLICLLLDRFKKRRHDRWIKQLLEDAKAGKLPKDPLEDPKNGVIEINEQGFSVSVKHGKKEYNGSVKWDEVQEIKVFKRDLFAVDLICWWFSTNPEKEPAVEINEEMLGYNKLTETIKSRFKIDEDWFQVAFPAFETNMRTIWQKDVNPA